MAALAFCVVFLLCVKNLLGDTESHLDIDLDL
jgi:hypothetical protein